MLTAESLGTEAIDGYTVPAAADRSVQSTGKILTWQQNSGVYRKHATLCAMNPTWFALMCTVLIWTEQLH
jgi:hypothetical protein